MTTRRRLAVLAVLGLAAAATAAPFAARAQNGAAAATGGATHIGVVNVSQVLKKTKELAALQASFRNKAELLRSNHDVHAADLKGMQDKLPGLNPGSDAYETAVKEIQKKVAEFQMDESLRNFDTSHEMSKSIKSLYDELQTAVATVAKQRGIDLVMVDNDPELPAGVQNLNPEDLQKVLSQRNVYYATPAASVTDAVATELDRMYAAKGGK